MRAFCIHMKAITPNNREILAAQSDITGQAEYLESSNGALNVNVVDNPDITYYETSVDEASATITYIGLAAPGSSEASAVWQIQRVDTSVSPLTDIRFADGVATFNKVWNDRASYTY